MVGDAPKRVGEMWFVKCAFSWHNWRDVWWLEVKFIHSWNV